MSKYRAIIGYVLMLVILVLCFKCLYPVMLLASLLGCILGIGIHKFYEHATSEGYVYDAEHEVAAMIITALSFITGVAASGMILFEYLSKFTSPIFCW